VRTYAALLRGINVGGRVRIPMSRLRSTFEGLGHEDVVTYLQSGNVVFRADGKAPELAAGIERRIAEKYGLDVAVLLRTPRELPAIAARNPFLADEEDLTKLHVVFLETAPARSAIARLDPARSPPDRFSARGRELYLHLPNGAGRSKLTNDYIERTLGTRATARNWRTVSKLVELTRP
jgi:uncharacterized protein (DUF1697 family)